MSNIEKISISLTPEMAANVKSLVSNGEFASSSEVIRTALREFQENRAQKAKVWEQIGKLWDEGIASGEPISADMVIKRIQKRIDNHNKKVA